MERRTWVCISGKNLEPFRAPGLFSCQKQTPAPKVVLKWAWTKAGVRERILLALIEQDLADGTTLMLDSTTIKVHQHASGAKKGDITRKPDGAEEA